jgi:hypothetical protein
MSEARERGGLCLGAGGEGALVLRVHQEGP